MPWVSKETIQKSRWAMESIHSAKEAYSKARQELKQSEKEHANMVKQLGPDLPKGVHHGDNPVLEHHRERAELTKSNLTEAKNRLEHWRRQVLVESGTFQFDEHVEEECREEFDAKSA
jgi:hypothetical protein